VPVHGSVAKVLKRQRRQLARFMYDSAETAGEMGVDTVQHYTPIGRIIDPATGQDKGESGALRDHMEPIKVTRHGDAWHTGVRNELVYTSWVNDGTKAHIIRGRMYLAFWTAGQLVITRRVKHPGFSGAHMFQHGLRDLDIEFRVKGDELLQAFLDRTEVATGSSRR
jgi:hypothetical protein